MPTTARCSSSPSGWSRSSRSTPRWCARSATAPEKRKDDPHDGGERAAGRGGGDAASGRPPFGCLPPTGGAERGGPPALAVAVGPLADGAELARPPLRPLAGARGGATASRAAAAA